MAKKKSGEKRVASSEKRAVGRTSQSVAATKQPRKKAAKKAAGKRAPAKKTPRKKAAKKPPAKNDERRTKNTLVRPGKCVRCGSTRHTPYVTTRHRDIRGMMLGQPYTRIAWKRTQCSQCGQHRVDIHYCR